MLSQNEGDPTLMDWLWPGSDPGFFRVERSDHDADDWTTIEDVNGIFRQYGADLPGRDWRVTALDGDSVPISDPSNVVQIVFPP